MGGGAWPQHKVLLLALTVHGSDLLIYTGKYLVSALEMQIHFSRPFSFKKRFKYNEYYLLKWVLFRTGKAVGKHETLSLLSH